MRIIHIMPGYVQNYYCENCLRDQVLVQSLQQAGHDIIVVPLYMPLKESQMQEVRASRIFYGGINVYLQQKSGIFRHTPRFLDQMLDAPGLLRWATRRSGMTKASELGELTYSTLCGADGRQKKELEQLIDWLKTQDRPDIVSISNALLLGLAAEVREQLDVPVVCVLQDEDDFLDALPEPWKQKNWDLMQQQARRIDLFVAGSDFYAGRMEQRLHLSTGKMQVCYYGIDAQMYEPTVPPQEPVIGFLSQVRVEKGFDVLVEAFRLLKRKPQFNNLRLHIAGDRVPEQNEYVRELLGLLEKDGYGRDVQVIHEFDDAARRQFLADVSVLSVPERHGDASAMYVLEAMAAGVPVVQPRSGVFTEWIELTGGGLLVEPEDPAALAGGLEQLLSDQQAARAIGEQGREKVREHFDGPVCAQRFVDTVRTRLNHDAERIADGAE